MGVSWNRGTPKSSIFMGFPFTSIWGYLHLWKPHETPYMTCFCAPQTQQPDADQGVASARCLGQVLPCGWKKMGPDIFLDIVLSRFGILFGSPVLSISPAICSSLELEPAISTAFCNILEFESPILLQ